MKYERHRSNIKGFVLLGMIRVLEFPLNLGLVQGAILTILDSPLLFHREGTLWAVAG